MSGETWFDRAKKIASELKEFERGDFIRTFIREGGNPSTAHVYLNQLLLLGLVVRIGRGKYRWVGDGDDSV